MTEEQKQFVLERLIPSVECEEGRGFDMKVWIEKWGEYVEEGHNRDLRTRPSCGTVCCLGGLIESLVAATCLHPLSFREAGKVIGLNPAQSRILFDENIFWPQPYRSQWMSAFTPGEKAAVAVALLKEVVRTNAAILVPSDDYEDALLVRMEKYDRR